MSESITILLYSPDKFTIYEFGFDGEIKNSRELNTLNLKSRASIKNIKGINIFSGTAGNFGQKDIFVVKYQ